MRYYIGNTDLQWYKFLRERNPEDINFWQPNGLFHFRAIEPGAPFLLKLKAPINKIAGIGFFSSHSILPINFAWEVFKERNGTGAYSDFYSKIKSYRIPSNSLDQNPNIGCIILTNPIFFDEKDWISPPENWARNIVSGKTYDTEDFIGRVFWERASLVFSKYQEVNDQEEFDESAPKYNQYLTKVRIGQGAFRILVTDAYSRRCAISGERTLPVLEAAHIWPYSVSGINKIENGLLLRSDLHKLYDAGYLTVTNDYRIEISKRIKEEFENGRDYYKYHGKSLVSLPNDQFEHPNQTYLKWHNENIFRA